MSIDNKYLNRNDIIDAINLLTQIKQYYRGIRQQKIAFDVVVNDLRKVYRRSPDLFSKMEVHVLQQLVNEIENYKNELVFTKTESSKVDINNLPKGTVVLHKKKFFVGVVVDNSDKNKGSLRDIEYRVFISEREVKLASQVDLIVLGTSVVNHCFNCNGPITMFLKKCKICEWRKCPYCDFCNCNYTEMIKNNKPIVKRQAVKRKAISLCLNCSKQGEDSCPGPSVANSSYRRQATFCNSFSPRHRSQDF